ncbi:uncharacterized protein LOC127104736 [Lathyrus oleraceus]|uniref:uncharacterized protein LOC127104736 n=1 Tax=Pisum sativum TaxID=3888 RepID=UPI0021CE54AF|nr:uncharacterized protein LOC127104736 [Pisum sativum]
MRNTIAELPPATAPINGNKSNLWDMVVDGYINPVDASVNKVERRVMTEQQKRDYKNHHKDRTILLNAISYTEYESITNKYTTKSIFNSQRMNYEGKAQVKETKALALIKKYEAFKMEDEETIENMFSRSHEIEIQEDEPKRKRKFVTLKSSGRFGKIKVLQAKTYEDYEEESKEEDELSLLSRHVNQLWKKRQGKFRGQRRKGGHFECIYGFKKAEANKDLTFFEFKEPGHFNNEYPKLKKERPKNNFRGKKKGLMATWDDSKSLGDDFEEEQANMALMACTKAPIETIQLESESESDSEEIFTELTRSELESSLSEVLDKYQKILEKYKDLKKIHLSESETHCKLKKDFSSLSEEKFILKNNNYVPHSKSLKSEKKNISKSSTGSGDIIKKYDKSF